MAISELGKIREYFGYESLAKFGADWRALAEKDKEDIRKGISDGSLNY